MRHERQPSREYVLEMVRLASELLDFAAWVAGEQPEKPSAGDNWAMVVARAQALVAAAKASQESLGKAQQFLVRAAH